MPQITKESVNELLKTIIDPNVEIDLVSSKSVKNIVIEGNNISVTIELGYPAKSYIEALQLKIEQALKSLSGVSEISVLVTSNIISHSVQQSLQPIDNVKNIIAVASGKGGGGKSTTSANSKTSDNTASIISIDQIASIAGKHLLIFLYQNTSTDYQNNTSESSTTNMFRVDYINTNSV